MAVATASKKTSRKAAPKAKPAEKVARKPHHPTHPPWITMITECITNTPDGTRQGVSRPAIKKFVDSKYHLPMTVADTSRLNRAISQGALRGNFVLPKGTSGKVKLAPKRTGEISKENKPTVPQHVEKKPKGVATKTKAPAVTKVKAATKAASAPKKYVSKTKKLRTTPVPGRQIPSKKSASKRSRAKKGVTGSRVATKSSKMVTRNTASASRKRTSKISAK